MTLDQFASRLQKAKHKKLSKGVDGYIGCCPAHEDHDPSFAVWEGEDGWLHFKCQRGCTEQDILSALHLDENDRRIKYDGPAENLTVYKYTDEHGNYLFEKVRGVKDGKKVFWQRIAHPGGAFTTDLLKTLGIKSKVMYHLPEVIEGIRLGKTIYLNEGEKAVEAFRKKGYVATCQPGGADEKPANKWLSIHTRALRNAEVVIVADRDQVGESYARYVASQLLGTAKSVRVVQSKTEDEKHDAYDHFAAGFDVDDFVPCPHLLGIEMSQRWVRGTDVSRETTEWLWRPYIPLQEITLLAGDPGVGKSTVAQAIAASVTLGAVLQGQALRQGDVIFLSAEQSVSRVTVPRFHELEADLSRILLPDDEDEEGEPVPFVLDNEGMVELRQQALLTKPKLIVIDTVTAYIEAVRDMNTSNQVREWMRRLHGIARAADCAVLVLAHTNKATQQKAIYRIAGSLDFVAASRSVLMCGLDPDDKADRAVVHIKSNVGPLGKALGYSVDEGRFGWTGESDLDAEQFDAPKTPAKERELRGACSQWLDSFLNGQFVKAADIEDAAKTAGFSKTTLHRAKKEMHLEDRREGFGPGSYVLWGRRGSSLPYKENEEEYNPWTDS